MAAGNSTPERVDPAVQAEIQRKVDEVRGEILDRRASGLNRWLAGTAIFLTVLAIIVTFIGYRSFESQRIFEKDAAKNLNRINEHKEKSMQYEGEAKAHRDGAMESAKQAQTAVGKANEILSAMKTRQAGAEQIEGELVAAVSLLKQGRHIDDIDTWKRIGVLVENSDKALGARIWLFVGSLHEKQRECGQAIEAYTRSIELRQDYARAYYERGYAWIKTGIVNNAHVNFTKARDLACESGDKVLCGAAATVLKNVSDVDWRHGMSVDGC